MKKKTRLKWNFVNKASDFSQKTTFCLLLTYSKSLWCIVEKKHRLTPGSKVWHRITAFRAAGQIRIKEFECFATHSISSTLIYPRDSNTLIQYQSLPPCVKIYYFFHASADCPFFWGVKNSWKKLFIVLEIQKKTRIKWNQNWH